MWNLKRQCRSIYLQRRNRDVEVENKYIDTKKGWVGDWH